jgi:putative phosphoesterase
MRIGVVSDTHGDTQGWQAAIAGPLAGVELILHVGDILYHGPRNPMPAGYDPAALADLMNHAPAPIIIARGNCDSDVDQLVLEYPIQAPYALAVIDGVRIIVNHGDEFGLENPVPGIAKVAAKYGVSLYVCGHTHAPMLERAGDCLIMNPGSPALPKAKSGEPLPTVGLIDDDIVRIMTLDGRMILEAAIERRHRSAG